MHKNINKIINIVLIGSLIGSGMGIFAIEDNNPSFEQFNFRNTLTEDNTKNVSLNYKRIGPLTIDNDITLGGISDTAVDLSLADEYFKYLVKSYLKPEGTLMLSDLAKVIGFDNSDIDFDDDYGASLKTDYEWLGLLPNIKDINIDISNRTGTGFDVTVLTSLKKLQSLYLDCDNEQYNSQLTNINQLYNLGANFSTIYISRIKGLEFIDFSKINGLTELGLDQVNFVDENQVFSTFVNSNTLKHFSLDYFSNENYVPYFVNLETFHIDGIRESINLNSLKNLKELYITGMFVHTGEGFFDVNTIKDLTNLKTLYLNPSYGSIVLNNSNTINNLTNLETLVLTNVSSGTDSINYNGLGLLKVLNLRNSDISSLENINNLTSLKTLNICDTQINNLDGVINGKYKSSLETLGFGNKNIKVQNLNLLTNIPNLKDLEVRSISINNVDNLFALKNLKDISLININGLKEITLKNTAIKSLYIRNYNVNPQGSLEKVNIPEDNKTIESLTIIGNIISDVSFVNKLKSLVSLDLSANQITDITPIYNIYAKLNNEKLNLDYNFAPKEQMDKVRDKFEYYTYRMYRFIKNPSITDVSSNIDEQNPADLIKFGVLQDYSDKLTYSMVNTRYKLEFILDDPRMGYVDSSFKLIPTKKGTITGTMRLYGDSVGENSFKLSFNSTVAENKGSIKIVYIDAATKKEIKAPTYLTGLNNGNITVTAETINGYNLVGNSSVVEIIDSSNLDKTVTFEFKKQVTQKGTVTINFVDDKTGLKIREPLVVTELALSSFTYKAENIKGYKLVGNTSKTVQITSEKLNHNMEFRYAKASTSNETVAKYNIVATKGDIEIAISKKVGIDLVGDKTTVSIPNESLVQVKNELSEVGLTIIEDISNKKEVLALAETNKLNVIDSFGALSNIKDLSKEINIKVTRDYSKNPNTDKLYIYKTSEKSRSLDLKYIGEASYKSGEITFTVPSNELDSSSFVISTKKAAVSGNTSTDADKKPGIPDTSGLALVIKILSIAGIAGAILLIRKKNK